MKRKTLHRLSPLIVTMLLGIFLTAAYMKTAPKENIPCTESKENVQCTESKNGGSERKTRSELMIWKSLSRHLLSLR